MGLAVSTMCCQPWGSQRRARLRGAAELSPERDARYGAAPWVRCGAGGVIYPRVLGVGLLYTSGCLTALCSYSRQTLP